MAITARTRLAHSRLQLTQNQLMGEDVDLTHLYAFFNHKRGVDLIEAIPSITIERTVEGASTVTVTVVDQDRELLRSGMLGARQDIEIDGLWFRLVSVAKSGKTLTLQFEDREIAVLRTYDKPIKQSQATSRGIVTRAQFILRLLKEVRELTIPYVIPELTKEQPTDATKTAQISDRVAAVISQTNKSMGIPRINDLTVKQHKMTEEARINANTILTVGSAKGMPRSLLVVSIMVGIQESTLQNLPLPSPGSYNYISSDERENPVGVFQQRQYINGKRSTWAASRDVGKDAASFFDHAAIYIASNKQMYEIAEAVQHSGNAQAYAQWRTEAERIVLEFGESDAKAVDLNAQWEAEAQTGDYEFYRGLPPNTVARKQKYGGKWGKENSWACMQRLAGEVNWRVFFVSGTFYYIAEDTLFRSKPIATITEDTDGVLSIDGDYDEGKKVGQVTISAIIGRWAAPPGSIVTLKDMGPWNGRWLVNTVRRSAFSKQGTIILKKPMPRLPEPSTGNLTSDPLAGSTWTGAPFPTDPAGTDRHYKTATAGIQPVPKSQQTDDPGGWHDTLGLTGYGAVDYFGKPGSDVLAVESGTIRRWSGHNPALGAIEGAGGPLGWSIYLLGDSGTDYYYTHLDKRFAAEGTKVQVGDVIATIANYDLFGRASHVHLGAKPGPSGHPDWQDIRNSPAVN
jgi:hypothetical protein